MDKRPNPYKIPPKFVVIEADEETPVNYRENFLFWCLGALSAMIVGLSLYEAEIQDRFQISRSPASVNTGELVTSDTGNFVPFENLPSLY